MLPSDRDARNALPVWDGCLMYFPDVWAEIAKVSVAGNKQYAFGGKLRWERTVSTDHENKVIRHMLDHAAGNVLDSDGTFHLAKAAWRVLAALQLAIEAQAVVNSANDHRADQEGRNAQGLGQEAQRAYHSGRYPQGGFEGTTGGQARELRADGKETL